MYTAELTYDLLVLCGIRKPLPTFLGLLLRVKQNIRVGHDQTDLRLFSTNT